MKSIAVAISLIILSIALLIPGITQPMLTITGTMDKQALKNAGVQVLAESMVSGDSNSPGYQRKLERATGIINGGMKFFGIGKVEGQLTAYQKTRSIAGTINDLYKANNILVAFLIGLFSIVIPVSKLLMLVTALSLKSESVKTTLLSINGALSKWSMADVFVVALIVTYMATNATSATGPTGETLLQFNSQFESGFYYFCAYCLCAIFAAQFINKQFSPINTIDKEKSKVETYSPDNLPTTVTRE